MAKGKPLSGGMKALIIVLTVVLSIGAGTAFGIGYGRRSRPGQTEQVQESTYQIAQNGYSGSSAGQLLSNPILSEKVVSATAAAQDSVVVLITSIMEEVSGFFGQSYVQEYSALGSGVIFREDNEKVYIMTNAHVIAGASKGFIYYDDETAVPIYLVGESVMNDLAVVYALKEDFPPEILEDLQVARLGDSDELRPGDLAIAIGSPYSQKLAHTTTVGIVTGIGLHFVVDDAFYDLETDAALNPGNSGGALVNENGEVIGINSAGIRDGVTDGMGFAVSINRAKEVMEDIFNGGISGSATLGIKSSVFFNEEQAKWYHFAAPGEYLYDLEPAGAAAAAGLRAGDLIVSLAGKKIDSENALQEILAECEAGQTVPIEYISLRSGKLVKAQVVLGTQFEGNTSLPMEKEEAEEAYDESEDREAED